MLYVQVWKAGGTLPGLHGNSYYADGSIDNPNVAAYICNQVALFDRFFSSSSEIMQCVTVHVAGHYSSWPTGNTWVWTPRDETWNGRVGVATPLNSRWALNVAFYPNVGRPSHRNYHGIVSEENLTYNHRGYPMLKGWENWGQEFADWCAYYGVHWKEWLKIGTGNAIPAEAFGFKSVVDMKPANITVTNKTRRHRSRGFQVAETCKGSVIGTAMIASVEFDQMKYFMDIDLPDYYPGDWKKKIGALQGFAIASAEAVKQMQEPDDESKNSGNSMCNDGDGWNIRFGVPADGAKGVVDKLKKQQEGDQQLMKKIEDFTDANGETFFHKQEALQLYDLAKTWCGYCAGYAFMDWGNIGQKKLKDMTRIGKYTPLWPDLEVEAKHIPRPKTDVKRREQTFVSAITHGDVDVRGTVGDEVKDLLKSLL